MGKGDENRGECSQMTEESDISILDTYEKELCGCTSDTKVFAPPRTPATAVQSISPSFDANKVSSPLHTASSSNSANVESMQPHTPNVTPASEDSMQDQELQAVLDDVDALLEELHNCCDKKTPDREADELLKELDDCCGTTNSVDSKMAEEGLKSKQSQKPSHRPEKHEPKDMHMPDLSMTPLPPDEVKSEPTVQLEGTNSEDLVTAAQTRLAKQIRTSTSVPIMNENVIKYETGSDALLPVHAVMSQTDLGDQNKAEPMTESVEECTNTSDSEDSKIGTTKTESAETQAVEIQSLVWNCMQIPTSKIEIIKASSSNSETTKIEHSKSGNKPQNAETEIPSSENFDTQISTSELTDKSTLPSTDLEGNSKIGNGLNKPMTIIHQEKHVQHCNDPNANHSASEPEMSDPETLEGGPSPLYAIKTAQIAAELAKVTDEYVALDAKHSLYRKALHRMTSLLYMGQKYRPVPGVNIPDGLTKEERKTFLRGKINSFKDQLQDLEALEIDLTKQLVDIKNERSEDIQGMVHTYDTHVVPYPGCAEESDKSWQLTFQDRLARRHKVHPKSASTMHPEQNSESFTQTTDDGKLTAEHDHSAVSHLVSEDEHDVALELAASKDTPKKTMMQRLQAIRVTVSDDRLFRKRRRNFSFSVFRQKKPHSAKESKMENDCVLEDADGDVFDGLTIKPSASISRLIKEHQECYQRGRLRQPEHTVSAPSLNYFIPETPNDSRGRYSATRQYSKEGGCVSSSFSCDELTSASTPQTMKSYNKQFQEKRRLLEELERMITEPFQFTKDTRKATLYEKTVMQNLTTNDKFINQYLHEPGDFLEERITGLKEGNKDLTALLKLTRFSQICILVRHLGEELVQLQKLISMNSAEHEGYFSNQKFSLQTLDFNCWSTQSALDLYLARLRTRIEQLGKGLPDTAEDVHIPVTYESSLFLESCSEDEESDGELDEELEELLGPCQDWR